MYDLKKKKFFFVMVKYHNIKFTVEAIFKCQFSGIKCIHMNCFVFPN